MDDGADSLGAMATAGLVAREIEAARGGRPAVGHAQSEACANCGAVRAGPYCHECGQAGHVHRTLGALVHDLAHGVFHFEGKIWNTLPLLALKPGELTRRYVHGERAKFVSPMALFLFSVFLMFAVVSNLGVGHASGAPLKASDRAAIGLQLAQANLRLANVEAERKKTRDPARQAALDEQIRDAKAERLALQSIDTYRALGPGAAGIEAGKAAARAAKADGSDRIDTGLPWLNGVVDRVRSNPELTLYKMKSYAYKYSWALIPISLPFIWLLFAFRRDTGLYDHAIFSIYSLSFMSLAVVVLATLSWLGLPTALVVLAVLLIPPLHMYKQLKYGYRLGRFGALWRTAALLLITMVTSSLFFAFLVYMGSD